MDQKIFYQELSDLLALWQHHGKRDQRTNYMESIPLKIGRLIARYTGFEMKFTKNNPLSFMEMLSLVLFAFESDRKKVATILGVKPSCTNQYETRIRQKLEVRCRIQAFRVALQNHYLSIVPISKQSALQMLYPSEIKL